MSDIGKPHGGKSQGGKSPGGKPQGEPQPSGLKTAIEMVPLLLFGITYAAFGIKTATGVLMVATVASLVASYVLLGHMTPMLIMTTILVVGFGSLTFLFDDPRFIKMKPTAVNLLFAGILAWGLATRRLLLKRLLGEALQLDVEGWRQLTGRWIGFFLVLAVLNEFVWRTMSETAWVNFKLFGILGLTFSFMIAQVGLIKRHALAPTQDSKSPIE